LGGLYGFIRLVDAMVRDLRAETVYVAMEGGGASRRRLFWNEYKASRSDRSEWWVTEQVDAIPQWSVLKGYHPVAVHGGEADDAIALLVRSFIGKRIAILTADHDLRQLLSEEDVLIYAAPGSVPYGRMEFEVEHGFSPSSYRLYKALVGCSSDGVPGLLSRPAASAICKLNPCWRDEEIRRLGINSEKVERNLKLVALGEDIKDEVKEIVVRENAHSLEEFYFGWELMSLLREEVG